MYQKAKYFIENNKLIKSELFDISELEKGFSVYEVVKIREGVPLFFEDHLRRLHHSANLKNKNTPFSDSEIKKNVFNLIDVNKIKEGRLKFAVRFYQSDNKLICFFLNPIIPTSDNYNKGIKIMSVQAERK
ncbi:MAG: aminotransferase class IV, partial [Bacteroidales bacterium]|nr:aminotransferase class IV [Bacteroidales bacterium]